MAVSIPVKLQSLRESSVARRIEAERRRNQPRQRNQPGKPKLSKYRRKCANAKERERMSKVNDMFDKLKTIVPEGLSKDLEDKETKVTTLRSAIVYINELQQLLTDYDAGSVDPSRYQDTNNTKENNNNNTKRKAGNKPAKSLLLKKKNQICKRKKILKPRWTDYSRSALKKSLKNCDIQPKNFNMQSKPCDIQPKPCVAPVMSEEYVVYGVDLSPTPVEYVVYQEDGAPVLNPVEHPKDYVVYHTDKDQVLNPEEHQKDYVIYRSDSEPSLSSPKDVNVISLYISLIDGKRSFDGKFSPEL